MHELLHSLTERWHTNLLNNKPARDKLKELYKLDKLQRLTSLDLGLVEILQPEKLTKKINKQLETFGLADKSLQSTISIPLRDKSEQIINYYFLSMDNREDRLLKKGGLINTKAFRVFKSLVLVDNMQDFLLYFQNVGENVLPLFPCDEMLSQFKEMFEASEVKALIFIGDSEVFKQLKSELEEGFCARIY